jgi:hypothetical protein
MYCAVPIERKALPSSLHINGAWGSRSHLSLSIFQASLREAVCVLLAAGKLKHANRLGCVLLICWCDAKKASCTPSAL